MIPVYEDSNQVVIEEEDRFTLPDYSNQSKSQLKSRPVAQINLERTHQNGNLEELSEKQSEYSAGGTQKSTRNGTGLIEKGKKEKLEHLLDFVKETEST